MCGAAVIIYVLVARHLNSVPQNNEPENLRSALLHVALMAILDVLILGAAVVAVVRGSFGRGKRGIMRAVPIFLGVVGLIAAAVCALVIFASALATRDV